MKRGDCVKLKRGIRGFNRPDAVSYKTAKIVHPVKGVVGGLELDRTLGGCVCWNVADLELVRSGEGVRG